MIQLIRNSIVHGIETPNDRISAGKVIKGVIKIALETSIGNDLMIRYSDDGAGLDVEKIKKNALDRGLVMEFELDKMNEKELAGLIFMEGFSTSEKSNKHAGRGQGMHLVKSIISDHKGKYQLAYQTGKSFELTIEFPHVDKNSVEI